MYAGIIRGICGLGRDEVSGDSCVGCPSVMHLGQQQMYHPTLTVGFPYRVYDPTISDLIRLNMVSHDPPMITDTVGRRRVEIAQDESIIRRHTHQTMRAGWKGKAELRRVG